MKMLFGWLLLIGIFLLNIALYYVVVPFILLKVLALFGISISFWLSLGIVFLVYILAGILKR